MAPIAVSKPYTPKQVARVSSVQHWILAVANLSNPFPLPPYSAYEPLPLNPKP